MMQSSVLSCWCHRCYISWGNQIVLFSDLHIFNHYTQQRSSCSSLFVNVCEINVSASVIKWEPCIWELLQTGKYLTLYTFYILYNDINGKINVLKLTCDLAVLFKVDPGNTGRVGPTEAALFLKKSGLPDVTLGKVTESVRVFQARS